DQVPERRQLFLHAPREADEIESSEVGLHEVERRAREPGELPDLDLPVLRQRAHRDDAGLVAGRERNHRFEHGAHLEHRALARTHAKSEERRSQPLGLLIQLAESELTVLRGERGALGHAARRAAHGFADREVDPDLPAQEFSRLLRRRIGHAVNRQFDSRHGDDSIIARSKLEEELTCSFAMPGMWRPGTMRSAATCSAALSSMSRSRSFAPWTASRSRSKIAAVTGRRRCRWASSSA